MRGLEAARPYARRLNVLDAPGGVTVVDDCYNANPASMAAALDTLRTLRRRRAGRWRCSATCWSSGPASRRSTRALGARAAAGGAVVAFFGPRSARRARGGVGAGRRERRTSPRWSRCWRWLRPQLRAGRRGAGEGQPRHAARAGGGGAHRRSGFRGRRTHDALPPLRVAAGHRRRPAPQLPRYPTFRIVAAGVSALVLGMLVGPRLIERLRLQPARAEQRARGHARHAPEEEGHAHDGRRADPVCIARRHAAVRRPEHRAWCGWRCCSPSATASSASSTTGSSSPSATRRGWPGARSWCCRPSSTWSAMFGMLCDVDGRALPHLLIDTRLALPFVPTHWFNPDLGWLYVLLRLGRGGGHLERGEPHRRAGRAGHRPHHRRRDHLRDPLLRGGHRRSTSRRAEMPDAAAGRHCRSTSTWASSRCRAARSWRCSAPRSSARASPSSGSTPTRRASSWATSARWRWAARSARWRC